MTEFIDTFKQLLHTKWIKINTGTVCTNCKSENIERSVHFMGGPYSGSVRCLDCNHSLWLCSHLGKWIFTAI